MGKYIGYALIVLVILFALEWFEVVDVPILEIPDLTSSKETIIEKSEDMVKIEIQILNGISEDDK